MTSTHASKKMGHFPFSFGKSIMPAPQNGDSREGELVPRGLKEPCSCPVRFRWLLVQFSSCGSVPGMFRSGTSPDAGVGKIWEMNQRLVRPLFIRSQGASFITCWWSSFILSCYEQAKCEFAIRCQRKRISCNGFLTAGKGPHGQDFPRFLWIGYFWNR